MTDWVLKEYSHSDFGDKRLNLRGQNVLSQLSHAPLLSLPQASSGWSELNAAYRFFNNDKVTVERILSPHLDATIERIKGYPVVLVPQDTTEFDFTGRKIADIGPLAYDNMLGYLCHTSLAITPDRVCLGVVDSMMWYRDPDEFHKRATRKDRPIEEKESFRWVRGYQLAAHLSCQAPTTRIVSISDREGDIYECFVEAQSLLGKGEGADWIIRSYQDRSLPVKEPGEKDVYKKLRKTVASTPPLGTASFTISKTKKRKKRMVTQTIRATSITLKPPFRKGKKLPPVTINVVYALEENPPAGEEPIEWFLLTSLPITTIEEIFLVIEYYLCRWQIEIFFKILKSGCAVEKIQLETKDSLLPCIALYMIIAWRVFYLMMLGRSFPELPCDVVFEEDEWKAAYSIAYKKPPPKKPPSLGEIIRITAKFGGYLGRKNDPPPGPKSIWTGIQTLYNFTIALKTFNSIQGEDTS